MIGDELLQITNGRLRFWRGRGKVLQLAQLCKVPHQIGRVAGSPAFFMLLIFLIGDGIAPFFFDLCSVLFLLGLIKCVKFHRCYSCF